MAFLDATQHPNISSEAEDAHSEGFGGRAFSIAFSISSGLSVFKFSDFQFNMGCVKLRPAWHYVDLGGSLREGSLCRHVLKDAAATGGRVSSIPKQ